MKKYLLLFLSMTSLSCTSSHQKKSVEVDNSAIIEKGIDGRIPWDLKTQMPFQSEELLYLDHYVDSVEVQVDLSFLNAMKLPFALYDSLKLGKSNADFWTRLGDLYPNQQVMLTFTKPIVKNDTATFQYTWQGMVKGSGKSFLIKCIKNDSTWSFLSQEMRMAF